MSYTIVNYYVSLYRCYHTAKWESGAMYDYELVIV